MMGRASSAWIKKLCITNTKLLSPRNLHAFLGISKWRPAVGFAAVVVRRFPSLDEEVNEPMSTLHTNS